MTFVPMTDEQIAKEEAMDEFCRELEKKNPPKRLTSEELKEIFPEILDIAPLKVAEIEDKMDRLERYSKKNPVDLNTLEGLWEQGRRDKAHKELKRQLMRFKRFIPTVSLSGVTDAEIAAAREYPILDLVDEPRRSGSMYTIHCPLHEENTPSCKIYVKSNDFWCFGCNRGGDTIDFVMARDEVDFVTAVRQLTGVS